MASFLQKLFKPKWQHADSSVRLEAITNELDQDTLLNLAANDPEVDVRVKAIPLLQSLSAIRPLVADKHPEIKKAAISQYIKNATNEANTDKQIQGLKGLESRFDNSSEILLTIASEASNAELAQSALDLVREESALIDFIMSSQSSKARLKAAEKIHSLDLLKNIETCFKGKDKTLHRFAKSRIQSQSEADLKVEQSKQETLGLLNQVKLLSTQAFNPTYEAQTVYLKQVWESAEYTEELNTEFKSALKICEETLFKNKELQAELSKASAKKSEAQALRNQALNDIESLIKTFKEKGVPSLNLVTEALANTTAQWNSSEAISQSSKSENKEFNEVIKQLKDIESCLSTLQISADLTNKKAVNIGSKKSLLKSVSTTLKNLTWPKELPLPSNLSSLIELENKLKDEISTLKDSEYSQIKDSEEKLIILEKEIEAGNLKQATKTYNEIKKSLSLIDRVHAKNLNTKFQVLTNDLNNLKDWKGFAAEPKFIELCEKIEGLIDSQLEAKELAASIQDLQNQWKSLGSLGDKKQQDILWARFKAASDKAYIPCKAYYDDLSNIRLFNLEQRKIICEQLETLFQQQDWDKANWKGMQKITDKAFHEYKKFAPVDRAKNTAIQKRFNEATQAIKQKLSGYYQTNLDAKQALINECSDLLNSEDLAAAIERCKAIQEEWKGIESAGKSEQSLWVKFREKCDAIFERRKDEYQAKRSHTDGLIAEAQLLVDQAKALETSSNRESLAKLSELKQSIQGLDIPAKIATAKKHVISSIEKTIQENIKQSAQAADLQQWLNARDLSAKMAQQEINANSNKEDIKALFQDIELPKGILNIFINRVESPVKADLNTLKEHCLEFEINLGIESPADEQQDRMALQIKRLQENMGKQQLSRQEAIIKAQCDWFGFSADSEEFLELQERFFQGLSQTTTA